MKNKAKEIVLKDVKDLKHAEYNPRQLSKKEFKDIKESIDKFGFVEPIVVNINEARKNVIIGGHQRAKIWEKLGSGPIPCIEVDIPILKDEKELNIRLNKNSGSWDFDILGNEFELVDLINYGFEAFELGLEAIENETAEPEPERKFILKIDCIDEAQQLEYYDRLTEEGLTVAILEK